MAESDWTSASVEIQHRTALPNPFISRAVEVADSSPLWSPQNSECGEGEKSIQRISEEYKSEKIEGLHSSSPVGLASKELGEPLETGSSGHPLDVVLPIGQLLPILDLDGSDDLTQTSSAKPLRARRN
jgi:hypothetical protein